MRRTRLESFGLIWHSTQMLITTYLVVGPKRIEPGSNPAGWMILLLPFAAGCWLAGLLRTPTPNVLLLAALYWGAMAIAIQGSSFTWDFGAGLHVDVTILSAPRVSIDILAAASAAVFATAWYKRRLTIAGAVRDT